MYHSLILEFSEGLKERLRHVHLAFSHTAHALAAILSADETCFLGSCSHLLLLIHSPAVRNREYDVHLGRQSGPDAVSIAIYHFDISLQLFCDIPEKVGEDIVHREPWWKTGKMISCKPWKMRRS
jgi:hypothetical protein